MTDPDYRAMCAELFVKLKEWDSSDPYHDCGPLLCRARAALAEGEVGSTSKRIEDQSRPFPISPMKGCPLAKRSLPLPAGGV